jgi:hypothetical protein
LAGSGLGGCVWTGKPDFATYDVGELVNYCYSVSQPGEILIAVEKPDGGLVVVDGFVAGTGGCTGPFEANYPLGARTVRMFAKESGQLLSETHFAVR